MRNPWVLSAVATVVLTMLQALFSFLVPRGAPPSPGGFGLVLLSNAMIASLLVWVGGRLRAQGHLRALVLWAVWGGIQANAMVEAVLFDVRIPPRDVGWLTLFSLAYSGGLALFLGSVLPRSPAAGGQGPRAATPAWWRWAACDVTYIALYFGAGMLVWPWLREFYEARPMPSASAVVAVQVFRGLALSAIAFLIVRQLRVGRLAAAAAAGLVLSVLGGVAPLIVPNPYLPEAVRYAHLPEVGVSNFLFGLLAGWLLAPPARERAVSGSVVTASA
jgi:hypothetical protein